MTNQIGTIKVAVGSAGEVGTYNLEWEKLTYEMKIFLIQFGLKTKLQNSYAGKNTEAIEVRKELADDMFQNIINGKLPSGGGARLKPEIKYLRDVLQKRNPFITDEGEHFKNLELTTQTRITEQSYAKPEMKAWVKTQLARQDTLPELF